MLPNSNGSGVHKIEIEFPQRISNDQIDGVCKFISLLCHKVCDDVQAVATAPCTPIVASSVSFPISAKSHKDVQSCIVPVVSVDAVSSNTSIQCKSIVPINSSPVQNLNSSSSNQEVTIKSNVDDVVAASTSFSTDVSTTVVKNEPNRRIIGTMKVVSNVTPFKFKVKIGGYEGQAMLDSGASTTFISTQFVKRHGITAIPRVSTDDPSVVILADGTESVSPSIVIAELQMSGYKEELKFNCMDLPVDMILGLDWLHRINPVVDWKIGNIRFKFKGRDITVVSISNPSVNDSTDRAADQPLLLNYTQFKRLARKESSQCYAVYVRTCDKEEKKENIVADEIKSEKLNKLLKEYEDVFSELPSELPPVRNPNIEHKIDIISDAKIPSGRIYKMNPEENDELKKQIEELLKKNFIRVSTSPYSSPVLFVKKKDGTYRLCVDYRALNAITVKNRYPLPLISDLFDRLSGAQVFTSLDFNSGYNQIRVRESDIEKTAFVSRYGLYEYMVLPFGLTGAPSTFSMVMNNLFKDVLDKFVIVYLDDILIYSRTEEEHLEHLQYVLDLLRKNKFYCKRKKCDFMKARIKFVGHVVSKEGLETDPDKVEKVVNWPRPDNVTKVREFIGFSQFHRKFIPNFSSVTAPLTELTKHDAKFDWTNECEVSFIKLKNLMSKAPVLLIPDLSKPFTLITDASSYGIGGVLCQDHGRGLQPIAYESRKFSKEEQNYPVREQELLAIFYCCLKFRHYLESNGKFCVYTDHNSLRYIFTQKPLTNKRIIRWLDELVNFDFDIKHVPGSKNLAADALSRLHRKDDDKKDDDQVMMLNMIEVMTKTDFEKQLKDAYQEDEFYQDVVKDKSKLKKYALRVKNDILIKINEEDTSDTVLYVPAKLRSSIMYLCHENSGHFGRNKTVENMKRSYWWNNMNVDIEEYVKSCRSCQAIKYSTQKTPGLLQPIPPPTQKFAEVTMDFITHLPMSTAGYDCIMVVVDRLSKVAKFTPTKSTFQAPDVAASFFDKIVCNYGLPLKIISDRDPKFTSLFWQELWSLLDVKLGMSTAFHPATDGQTEVINRILEDLLRSYCHSKQADWLKSLPLCEFYYNNSVSSTTGYSPFFLLYGCHPLTSSTFTTHIPHLVENIKCESLSDMVEKMQEETTAAIEHIKEAQARQASYANKKRRELVLNVDDKVMLSSKNINFAGSPKLSPRWFGPFVVTEKINDVAYRLQLPSGWRIHDVFHVSLLKRFVEDSYDRAVVNPPPVSIDSSSSFFEVEKILDKRIITVRKKPVAQYLIQWRGFSMSDCTWEPIGNLKDVKPMIDAFELERMHKIEQEQEKEQEQKQVVRQLRNRRVYS